MEVVACCNVPWYTRVGEERLFRRGGGELFENRPWYGIRLLENWCIQVDIGLTLYQHWSRVRLVVVALVNVTRGADLTISVR